MSAQQQEYTTSTAAPAAGAVERAIGSYGAPQFSGATYQAPGFSAPSYPYPAYGQAQSYVPQPTFSYAPAPASSLSYMPPAPATAFSYAPPPVMSYGQTAAYPERPLTPTSPRLNTFQSYMPTTQFAPQMAPMSYAPQPSFQQFQQFQQYQTPAWPQRYPAAGYAAQSYVPPHPSTPTQTASYAPGAWPQMAMPQMSMQMPTYGALPMQQMSMASYAPMPQMQFPAQQFSSMPTYANMPMQMPVQQSSFLGASSYLGAPSVLGQSSVYRPAGVGFPMTQQQLTPRTMGAIYGNTTAMNGVTSSQLPPGARVVSVRAVPESEVAQLEGQIRDGTLDGQIISDPTPVNNVQQQQQ